MMPSIPPAELIDAVLLAVEQLQSIDFGRVEAGDAQDREAYILPLEEAVHYLTNVELEYPESELAIRHFITDPARSRTYVYGPTDTGDGRGLLEKLKSLLAHLHRL